MIRVNAVPFPLDEERGCRGGEPFPSGPACTRAARALGISPKRVRSAQVVRRSVDARKKSQVRFIANLDVTLDSPELERRLVTSGAAQPQPEPASFSLPDLSVVPEGDRPVVVGFGPAGLFCALALARAGARPLVIERGEDVDARSRRVAAFNAGGPLDPESNIQFGEGGAGTFSDGKLTTNANNPLVEVVLRWFVEAGAPDEVLWTAKPHIGSDLLTGVVKRMREEIIRLGGEVRFDTRLEGLAFEGGRLRAIRARNVRTGAEGEVPCRRAVLACGHSARELFSLLQGQGVLLEQKPFAIGARIEHPQALVNAAQWGPCAGHGALAAAEYKLAEHVSEERSAYTFCMCPGGVVVCAASEEGGVVTNGMSDHARDGENANAALLVNVGPGDFGSDDPLAGMRFQQRIERAAFEAVRARGGAPYQAPAERVGDFLAGSTDPRPATGACAPTYARGVVWMPLDEVLPAEVCATMRQAIGRLDRRLRGFAHPDAVLTGPETRSSSPVRIVRGADLQAFWAAEAPQDAAARRALAGGTGIYPAGEGAGYAGGIMSAAIDGLRVAERIAAQLAGVGEAAC